MTDNLNIPRRARKAIERTAKAIDSVRLSATEEDLAVSVDGLSLASALEDCSRLTAVSGCQDQKSIDRIERITPLLSSMTYFLEERNKMRRRMQGLHSRSGDSTRLPFENINEQMESTAREVIEKNLGRLKSELEFSV